MLSLVPRRFWSVILPWLVAAWFGAGGDLILENWPAERPAGLHWWSPGSTAVCRRSAAGSTGVGHQPGLNATCCGIVALGSVLSMHACPYRRWRPGSWMAWPRVLPPSSSGERTGVYRRESTDPAGPVAATAGAGYPVTLQVGVTLSALEQQADAVCASVVGGLSAAVWCWGPMAPCHRPGSWRKSAAAVGITGRLACSSMLISKGERQVYHLATDLPCRVAPSCWRQSWLLSLV